MAQIGIADKTTLDAVKTKVDANLDVATSSRAAQTTANTINTNVGSNADASSATGSAHAKLKDIKAGTGATGDAASATGTANAKLAELLNRIGAISPSAAGTDQVFKYLKKIFDAASGGGTVQLAHVKSTATGTITVLDVTGSGVINSISLPYLGQGVNVDLTMTLDGVAKSVRMIENLSQSTQIGVPVLVGPFRFDSSCKITITTSSNTAVEILIAYRTGV